MFSALLGVPVDAAYHVVSLLVRVLTPALGGLAAAAAIVAFTAAVRLLLLPLSARSWRGMQAQARIAPQAQALRQKYARQPDRLQRELTALYQAEGVSMFAGLGPLILQWPLLSVVYLLFRSADVSGQRNVLLSHNLFAAALGSHWLGGAGPASAQGAVFAVVFAALAVASLLTTRLARGAAASPGGGVLAWAAPFVSVVIAAFAPLAAGLYLVTSTMWTLGERAVFTGKLTALGGRRWHRLGG